MPTTTKTRAAIYTRISADPDGLRAGVEGQRGDCLELLEQRGWKLAETYEDNDRSAYNGKPRPAFDRLIADAAAGHFDVVVVWASDRLYRRMKDLVRIGDDLAPYCRIVTVRGGGDVDLTTAEGVLRAQVMGSVSEFESARKAERLTLRARQRATVEGRMTSAFAPFGWRWAEPCLAGDRCDHERRCTVAGRRPRAGSKAGVLPDDTQAPAVQAIMRLVADGGSVGGATRLLNQLGHVGPQTGRPYTPATTRSVLTNPRHAGLVSYRGTVVGDSADGHRIVDPEVWRTVQVRLSDPARRTSPGRPAGTAFSGIAVCGRCDGPMNASNKHYANQPPAPTYVCSRHGHLSRRRALIDEPVLSLVGEWLVANADAIAAHVVPHASGVELAAAREVAALTDRLASLSELAAAGELDPADYAATAKAVRARLTAAKANAVIVSGRPATARLLARGDVPGAWARLVEADDPEPLRVVLREILEAVVIVPVEGPGQRPTPDHLEVRWAAWTTPEAA